MLDQKTLNRLDTLKGARIVTLVAETTPKVKQGTKNNPSPFRGKGVKKIAKVNGIVNWKYANSVNNQRAREGNTDFFKSKPRKWGVRRKNSPFVDHNDKTYLELKVERVLDTKYLVDGKPICESELADFLPKRKQSNRQETEKAIILADYDVKNIKEIKF